MVRLREKELFVLFLTDLARGLLISLLWDSHEYQGKGNMHDLSGQGKAIHEFAKLVAE